MRIAIGVLVLLAAVVAVSALLAGCPTGPKPPESGVTAPETEPADAVAPKDEGEKGEEATTATTEEPTEEGAAPTGEKAEEETPAVEEGKEPAEEAPAGEAGEKTETEASEKSTE